MQTRTTTIVQNLRGRNHTNRWEDNIERGPYINGLLKHTQVTEAGTYRQAFTLVATLHGLSV